MKTKTHNQNRSLEMLVSAPIDDCVEALHSLEKGGWSARERSKVKTRAISPELVEFEVKLSINRGRAQHNTPLYGTLFARDGNMNTLIKGKVPPIENKLFVSWRFIPLFIVAFWLLLLSTTGKILFLLILFMVFPISLWFTFLNYEKDTQHLLTLVERTLRLTADRKKHRYAGYNQESPFYDEV